uniref:lactose-binding lectin l-2-like n=1 Tax=Scatophagus argus TaxID=75038 RepID=UPI001ED838A9|nr:lactose-binding lectin l-2-like [Scatophagus argus]
MLLFLFLFGLALAAESPSGGLQVMLQRGNCPTFWYNFNGRCYKYVSTHLSWADAELHCVSEGANLVSIHSLEEQTFVKDLIKNFDHSEGYTWIGLHDIPREGGWMWSDGSAVNFTFWAPGEPNNNQGGNEDCAHLNFGTNRKWNDICCDSTYPSVCEKRIAC